MIAPVELRLEIVEGAQAGRQIALPGAVEIGRDPDLPFVLDDNQVSRRHVRIDVDAHGAYVTDLGSKNGTYVNDQPIGGPRRLVPGDRIRIGLSVIELRSAEQVARQASVVGPSPSITQLDQRVLQPVPAEQLVPVEPPPAPGVPSFLVEESEPAFVPRGVVQGGPGAPAGGGFAPGENYEALARLVDARVKARTSTAAFAVLSIAGLAVLIWFGAR